MEGLNPGQLTRSSWLLSNGFRVSSKDEYVDMVSTILNSQIKINSSLHKQKITKIKPRNSNA